MYFWGSAQRKLGQVNMLSHPYPAKNPLVQSHLWRECQARERLGFMKLAINAPSVYRGGGGVGGHFM